MSADDNSLNALPAGWTSTVVHAVMQTLPPVKQQAWQYHSGKCLFKLRRCQAHLDVVSNVCKSIETLTADDFPMKCGVLYGPPIEEKFYSIYSGSDAQWLFVNVDAFFEAARSCADFSLDMLGCIGVLKTPQSSMNGFVKDIKRHRKYADGQLLELIEQYWSQHGVLVKSYRDSFAHYVSLAGDHWQTAINIKYEGARIYARYFLPDNPSNNKHQGFTYSQNIDAREFISREIEELENYIKELFINIARSRGVKNGRYESPPAIYENFCPGSW